MLRPSRGAVRRQAAFPGPDQRDARPRPLGTPGLLPAYGHPALMRAADVHVRAGCTRRQFQGLSPLRSRQTASARNFCPRWSLPPEERRFLETFLNGDASPTGKLCCVIPKALASEMGAGTACPKGRPASALWNPRPFARIWASCPDAGCGRPCPPRQAVPAPISGAGAPALPLVATPVGGEVVGRAKHPRTITLHEANRFLSLRANSVLAQTFLSGLAPLNPTYNSGDIQAPGIIFTASA